MESSKMESSKIKLCSICQGSGHNKRTCPFNNIRDDEDKETYYLDMKKQRLINDIKSAQELSIESNITQVWLYNQRPCKIEEVKIAINDGLKNDYLELFIKCIKDINELY